MVGLGLALGLCILLGMNEGLDLVPRVGVRVRFVVKCRVRL